VSDELSGGTSEREMYDTLSVNFAVKGEEDIRIGLKANRAFRSFFKDTVELNSKLCAFIGLSSEDLNFKSYTFIGS